MTEHEQRSSRFSRGEAKAPGEAAGATVAPGRTGLPDLQNLQNLQQQQQQQRQRQQPQQRRPADATGDEVASAASLGTSGTARALPFLDRIQAAFGRHDVGRIRAYVGGAAATGAGRMGARAFATGDQVAFAEAPDLHTAAHEAAHVIQQRAGVQLRGGVGQAGDQHEQHADAVADRVVGGMSAEALLDEYVAGAPGAGGTAGAAPVQRALTVAQTTIDVPTLEQLPQRREIRDLFAPFLQHQELQSIFGQQRPDQQQRFSTTAKQAIYPTFSEFIFDEESFTPYFLWELWNLVAGAPTATLAQDPRVRALVVSDLKWEFTDWNALNHALTQSNWLPGNAHSIPEPILALSPASTIPTVQWPPNQEAARNMHTACGTTADTILARTHQAGGGLVLRAVNTYVGNAMRDDLYAFLTEPGPHRLYDITIKNLHELTIEKQGNSDQAVLQQGWLGSYTGLWWAGDDAVHDELQQLQSKLQPSPTEARRLQYLNRIAQDRQNFGLGQVHTIQTLAGRMRDFLDINTYGNPQFMNLCTVLPGFDAGAAAEKHRQQSLKQIEDQERIELMVKRYEVTNVGTARNTIDPGNQGNGFFSSLVMTDLHQYV